MEKYRQRLKARNGLIQMNSCDEQLRMSEQGKYQFRLTQAMVEKSLMVTRIITMMIIKRIFHFQEEIIDFIGILSPKSTRSIEPTDEIDVDSKKKKIEDSSDEIFLFTGDSSSLTYSQTLTITPDHDPHAILLQTSLPSGPTRKRKAPNSSTDPNGPKRGRQKTKPLPIADQVKVSVKKKTKQTLTPTATTSILNTLLQLPSHQPKARPIDGNLLKSFVNTYPSSHSFGSN